MPRSIILAVLLCLTGTLPLCAQNVSQTAKTARTPLTFDCQCSDFVGSHYATAFLQLLAQNTQYQLAKSAVVTAKNGKVTALNWHVSVMTLDPSPNNLGQYAALSVVFLQGDSNFMMQYVQYCSRATVNACAKTTLATLSQLRREMGE